MSAQPKLRHEAAASLGRFFAQGIAMALVVPIMVEELGTSDYGLWVLAWSLLGLAGLLDLGFGTAAIKVIAEAGGTERSDERNAKLSTILALLGFLGILSVPCVVLLAQAAVTMSGIPPNREQEVILFMVLLGLRILSLGMPLSIFRGILYGGRQIVALSTIQTAASSVLALATWVALETGAGLVELAAIHLAVMLTEHAVIAATALHRIPELRLSWTLVDLRTVPALTSFSLAFFFSGLAGTVLLRTDPILVQIGASLTAVAAYGLAQKLVETGTMTVKQLTNLMAPRAAQAKDEASRRSLLLHSMQLGTAATLAVALPLVILAGPLLEMWLGDVPGDTEAILLLLAGALLLSGPQLGAAGVLAMSGWHHLMGRLALASAGLNLGLSFLWVQRFGVLGVAAATLVVTFVFDVFVVPTVAARRFALRPAGLWLAIVRPLARPGVVWISSLVLLRLSPWSETLPGLVAGVLLALLGSILTAPWRQAARPFVTWQRGEAL
ncbi:MAG: oligosaccharide flippase family protein [Thermoanaerobaculia bacterium]|nr:oligosaccharide flippase family protein [Thermoanaerobaculia bacterium]